jgi:hypothetical protein
MHQTQAKLEPSQAKVWRMFGESGLLKPYERGGKGSEGEGLELYSKVARCDTVVSSNTTLQLPFQQLQPADLHTILCMVFYLSEDWLCSPLSLPEIYESKTTFLGVCRVMLTK